MDRPSPLVTMVVPTYTNDFATCRESPKVRLTRCLRSIINQPYPNVEVLVCDDGTPDYYGRDIVEESMQEIRREVDESAGITFKHLRWEHRGQAYVLNDGFAAARGDYVMDLNDDDYLMHDFLNEGVRFMEAPKNREFGLLYSDYCVTFNWKERHAWASGPWDPEKNKIKCGPPVIGLFRAMWAKKIKWDVELNHNEDWDYLLRFAQAGGKAAYIPGLFSFMLHQHAEQKSEADKYGVAKTEEIIRQRVGAGYYD